MQNCHYQIKNQSNLWASWTTIFNFVVYLILRVIILWRLSRGHTNQFMDALIMKHYRMISWITKYRLPSFSSHWGRRNRKIPTPCTQPNHLPNSSPAKKLLLLSYASTNSIWRKRTRSKELRTFKNFISSKNDWRRVRAKIDTCIKDCKRLKSWRKNRKSISQNWT